MEINAVTIILALGIPSAITGLCFHFLKMKMEKNDAREEERDRARIQNELLIISSVCATMNLAEATAKAIRDGTTNGEMTAALYSVAEVKKEQQEFLQKQAINHLH